MPSSVVTFLLFGTLGYIAENVESRGYSAPPAWINATSDAPYVASSHSSSPEPAKPWTCPKCGRYNISMAEICECGASRPLKKAPNKNAWSDAWTCPDCGRVNPSYNGTCACGKVRPK